MAHTKGKKSWRKKKVNTIDHLGKILNVRCCCEGEKIIGRETVNMQTLLDFFHGELAIKSHA